MNYCYCTHPENDHDIALYRHRCLWCGCPVFELDKELTQEKNGNAPGQLDLFAAPLDSMSSVLDSLSV